MASQFNTRVNPNYIEQPGAYGSVFANSGMTVAELVAAAMGQHAYRGAQQQQTQDAVQASPGALMGLLRGGVAPQLAQAAVGQQASAQRGPAMQGSDPFLDMMAANQMGRQTDFQVNEAILDYLASQKPDFMDKVGPIALALGGMAVGGLGLPGVESGMLSGGGLAGAALGGTVGSTLSQLLASRY